MTKLVVVMITQFLMLRSNIARKGGWKNPSSILFLLYFAISALSIPHVIINSSSRISDYALLEQGNYWSGAIVYILSIFIYLLPFYYFKENSDTEIRLPNLQVLNLFSAALIVLSLFSIAFYLPSVIRMFRSGVALSALRNNLDTMRTDYVETGGIMNTIASVASSFSPFCIMLFYIYYIIGKHPIRCALLFISSASKVIAVLSFVGRDGIVFWLINFAFMYFLFGDYIKPGQKKKIRSAFFIGGAAGLVPFFAISVSRFGDGDGMGGTFKAILSYAGQMVPNYLLYFDVRQDHYCYGKSFPLYWEITKQTAPEGVRWIDGGTESNVFGTFLKSFNINFGVAFTIIIGILAALFFVTVFRKEKKRISFHHYFIYILYFHILSEGLFYFKDSNRGGNLFILICFAFYLLFAFAEDCFGTMVLRKLPKESVAPIPREKRGSTVTHRRNSLLKGDIYAGRKNDQGTAID